MTTDYAIIKEHFDRLFIGGYPYSNGLEPIRDVYEQMFDRKINLYDVYKTDFTKFRNNPTDSITTLVGPEPNESENFPDGFIPCRNSITFVNVLPESIFKGIDQDQASWYINSIYNCIDAIVSKDSFYGYRSARNNPHTAFLRLIPIYLTYHHVLDCASYLIDDEIFQDIIDRDVTNENLLEQLKNSKYSTIEEEIYSMLTDKNKIQLF